MARLTFATSACLTCAGICLGVSGVESQEFKPVVVGLILITGGAVFALLTIAPRRPRPAPRWLDDAD